MQELYARAPDDPLFLADGSDDGLGHGTTRIRADATIPITLPLPPSLSLASDPTARTITVRRGIPTTRNTPALDPVLMYDGREPTLESQALDAIAVHDQATVVPTTTELQRIAAFEQTDSFFSSPELRDYAHGGPPPPLPEGYTASEKRGRRFFLDVPLGPGPNATDGMCAICHSGPMLNTSNGYNPLPVPPFFVPKGTRFQSILVAELNTANNPVLELGSSANTVRNQLHGIFRKVSVTTRAELVGLVSRAAPALPTPEPETTLGGGARGCGALARCGALGAALLHVAAVSTAATWGAERARECSRSGCPSPRTAHAPRGQEPFMIRSSIIAAAVLCLLAAGHGCDSASADQAKVDDAQKEANTKIAAVSSDADAKIRAAQAAADKKIAEAQVSFVKLREDYRHTTTMNLATLDKKIADLDAKDATATAAAKADLDLSLARIHAARAHFAADVSALESASAATWDAAKANLDKEWSDLEALVDKA